jgi:hypothetical protein
MAVLVLGALVVVFFHNALIGGEQFYAGDTYRYFYPLKKMAAEAVRSGQAPVWNPLVHSGMPLHAAMQAAIFYPFSVLFYVLPFDSAYKWYVALHIFLAAAGTYSLMRRWRLKPVAAAFAGITYAFSGYVISFIDGLNIFSSIVWLPIVFLLFEWGMERPSPSRVILAAFAVAAQALAGDPVSGYYTFLICGIYWLILLFTYSRQGRPRLENFRRMAVLPAVAVLALLLSYVQVGPSQELARYSTRAASIGYDSAVAHSLDPLRLLTLVVPYLFGNSLENLYDWGPTFAAHFPLERTLYFGIMPLLLIPVAVLAFRERRVDFFAGILVLGLLLSLGKYTPLYGLVHSLLPMFGKFRYPVKAFFLVSFAAAALAGYGMQYLVSQESSAAVQRMRPAAKQFMRHYSSAIIGIFFVLLITSFSDRFFFDLSGAIFVRASSSAPSVTQTVIPYMKGELLRASLLLFLAAALIWLRHKKYIPARVFRLLAFAFLLIDLLPATYRAMDTTAGSFYTAPRLDSVLRADKSLFRLYRTPLDVEQHIGDIGLKNSGDYYLWNREMLSPNFGNLFGYAYTDGYESANLLWHNMFIKFVEAAPPLLRPRLLGLVNVKYIFSSHPVSHPDLQLKMSFDNNVFLYQNSRCLPRAYFAPISVVAANEQIALRVLASDAFDPRQAVVLVDKGGPGSLNPQPGIDAFAVEMPPEMRFTTMDVEDFSAPQTHGSAAGEMADVPVEVIEYSSNEVRLKLNAPFDGHLVLCDAYYPLWKATINGQKTAILRANCTVRAVAVPSGESIVEFTYDTRSFKSAAIVSLAAAVSCVGIAIFELKRRRKE